MAELERIPLGSGDLYALVFDGVIPADSIIEADMNLAARISGGASIEYKPSFYTAKDDSGKVTRTIITDEESTLKTGYATWNGDTLEQLSATARVSVVGNKRTVKIGGISNFNGKKYLLRFVHRDAEYGDMRITIVGQNQSGFILTFAKDKESIIDAEFKALPCDNDGTQIIFEETIPYLGGLNVTCVPGTTGKTKINTVYPDVAIGNTLKAQVASTAVNVSLDTICTTGWTAVTVGTTELAATNEQYITVVEVDTNNKAKQAGTTKLINQIG